MPLYLTFNDSKKAFDIDDGRSLHHLRSAHDIVLVTPIIEQAERMLAELDSPCGKNGSHLSMTEVMFMKSEVVTVTPFTLTGMNISECFSYVYIGREVNVVNDLAAELSRKNAPSREHSRISRESWRGQRTSSSPLTLSTLQYFLL
ncbi:hypothetical protein V3C99_005108 [Haemonchus contortus]|uniref:Reverse transcriptase domain-containing protein n=1 Tax=Haemonchus contortus TaxID=6289 RepID=A0A7I4XV09_HAECO